MRAHVGILPADLEQLLVGEDLEEFLQAAGGLPGPLEERDRGLVGLVLHAARVAQQEALGDGGAASATHAAPVVRVARPHSRAGGAEGREHLEDHRHHRLADLLAHLDEVPALDVTRLVGDHADDLAGVVAPHQQARVQVHVQAVGDERVERAIVDEMDADRRGIERRGREKWRREGPDGSLDLGVADEADRSPLRLRARGERPRERHGDRSAQDQATDAPQKSSAPGHGMRRQGAVWLHVWAFFPRIGRHHPRS